MHLITLILLLIEKRLHKLLVLRNKILRLLNIILFIRIMVILLLRLYINGLVHLSRMSNRTSMLLLLRRNLLVLIEEPLGSVTRSVIIILKTRFKGFLRVLRRSKGFRLFLGYFSRHCVKTDLFEHLYKLLDFSLLKLNSKTGFKFISND
jgi:hypothetical protein